MSELFSRFEVNKESRARLLLALLAGSVMLHVAFAATVLYVPRVRDALNIAVLAGQTNYVDKAYRKTTVGEDIQMVEVAKFRYPDGYFATDLTAAVVPTPDPMAPKIISTYTPPNVEAGPSPTPSPQPSPSGVPTNGDAVAKASPGMQAGGDVKAGASPEVSPGDDEVLGINETEFNKRPLKDWLAKANDLKEKGTINLDAVVEMSVDARLTEDCKLEEPKVVQKSGDQQMINLAKELAAAIGDSRMLLFLKDPEKVQKTQKGLRCDPMPLRFNVKLDQTDFNATVETEADTPERATQLSGVYNWALAGGALNKKGRDEEIIFKNTKVTAEGKQIVVHFKLPRNTASEMLKKQLEAKTVETKPAT
ncbi:MAG TPA: hypothetical protein VGN86_08155 [Pyrinomonadaceae bacterium]|nr:hypothetical protein [Pyrinomonadaceae bacterium]